MLYTDVLLTDLLQEMEITDKARGLTDKTVKKNRKFLLMFFRYLDSEYSVTTLRELQPVHIKQFMIYKKNEGAAESYVNVFLRCIRALCKYAEGECYITAEQNPTLRVKWMKEQKRIIRAWSDEDIIKMINYSEQKVRDRRKKLTGKRGACSLFIAERDLLMVLLLIDTGLRVGELMNLSNKNLTSKAVYVINGKGKKDRVVYCSPKITKQRMKYKRAKQLYFSSKEDISVQDYVFVNKDGNRLSVDMAERIVTKIGQNAGCDNSIRMSPHTFRHYFTQKQLDLGANVYDLQILLGHSSIKTTETYLKSISSKKVLKRGLEKSPLMNLSKKRS